MKTISRSDFQTHGFDEAEIVAFLARHGIDIGNGSTPSRENGVTVMPDWKHVMGLLPSLTDREAASAFAGIDLGSPGNLSDDEAAELSRWQDVLRRAIKAGELSAQEAVSPRLTSEKEWTIRPSDLAAWCNSKGRQYPLQTQIALPATDAEMRNALLESEQERTRWKARAEELEASADERISLSAEISRLRKELRGRDDEVAKMRRELESLRADTLAGKTRATALKIIGGLAMEAYRMDIHGERLDQIGEMLRDLEKAGASITEKTLRSWIRQAADVIEPRQEKP